MERYRVALVSDWYYPKIGGIEYSIDSLASALKELGHEVHIITRRYSGRDNCNSRNGIKVIRVKGRELDTRFISPSAYWETFKILKSGNYDIIHAHGLDSPLASFSLIAGRKFGIPSVMTNHSLAGRRRMRPLLLLAGRFFLRYADAVIAVSSAVEKESKIMAPGKVYQIPNGIGIEKHDREKTEFKKDGKIVIATVARMTPKKRVIDIVDIAPEILIKHSNITFLIIGDGPLKKKIEKRARELGVAENFHFTGEVRREEVLNLLESSEIFALPSEDEAFGISILEAISKGVAVVARNNSGVSDIISHKKTGLLADSKAEMKMYIEKLVENPELRQNYATSAHEELYKYNWIKIAKKTEEVYMGVTNAEDFNHS